MFAEHLLESGHLPRTSRGWATATSLLLQAGVIGVLALVPVLFPEALRLRVTAAPQVPVLTVPIMHVQQDLVAHSGGGGSALGSSTPSTELVFHPPGSRPRLELGVEEGPTPGPFHVDGYNPLSPCITGCGPGSGPGSNVVLDKPFRISDLALGAVINKVVPAYPTIARTAGIEGDVVLHAIIGRAGTIESLEVIKGHPMLTQAARAAVSQWRYRPYLLNGQPVEVETEITVSFHIAH